jgi:hypothetical protein
MDERWRPLCAVRLVGGDGASRDLLCNADLDDFAVHG